MLLEITRLEGLRNDLLLRLDRREIQTALLSLVERRRLAALPGIPRHRAATAEEQQDIAAVKTPIDDHLRGLGIIGAGGRAERRAVGISNRNLGTNHGHVAWQRIETPPVFHVREDPCDQDAYSCLTAWRDGTISIEDLRFDFAGQRVRGAGDDRDLGDEIEWATSGQRVLRGGAVARIDEIAGQFYDVRHLLAAAGTDGEDGRLRRDLYAGYPQMFADNIRRAWRESRVPRARYFHNAIGLSATAVVIIQREGTVEEVGSALQKAGAVDGLILDNGGSVACWAWWVNDYAGGLISPTVDYRPPGTSAIAFVLKGPLRPELPGGSESPTVL